MTVTAVAVTESKETSCRQRRKPLLGFSPGGCGCGCGDRGGGSGGEGDGRPLSGSSLGARSRRCGVGGRSLAATAAAAAAERAIFPDGVPRCWPPSPSSPLRLPPLWPSSPPPGSSSFRYSTDVTPRCHRRAAAESATTATESSSEPNFPYPSLTAKLLFALVDIFTSNSKLNLIQ